MLDEDTTPEPQLDGTLAVPLYAPPPEHLLHEARRTVRIAEGRLLRTLGLDARSTPVPDRACPWCGGDLELHTAPDTAPSLTCSTGRECTAPVPFDEQGWHVWGWGDLVALVAALAEGGQPQRAA